MKYKCFRCKQRFPLSRLIDFIEGDTISPRFCKKCYLHVVENWEPGMSILDFEDQAEEQEESDSEDN